MVLVFALSALVCGAAGAALGALMARFAPRAAVLSGWAVVLAGTAYLYLQGRTLDEYDRISANVLVFAVLVPLLLGSLIAALLVPRRRPAQ